MEEGALVWLLLAMAAAAAAAEGVGAACETEGGAVGWCLPIGDCPPARDAVRKGEVPTACFFQGFTPVVCCPAPALSTPPPAPPPPPPPAQPQRVASRMCKKYAEAVYINKASILLPKAEVLRVDTCGFRTVPLIVGGSHANYGELPHMALLGYHTSGEQPTWLCGGSLISERFVLTAAHCFTSEAGAPKVVRLGELNLNTSDVSNKHEDFRVAQIISHPDYDTRSNYNDLGLLRLDRDVSFTPSIRPLCLQTQTDIGHSTAIASGWGYTDWVTPGASGYLMKMVLPIQKTEVCQNAYKTLANTKRLAKGIDEDSMVCAGAVQNGDRILWGDSGGPLQVVAKTPYCMYSVVGVASFCKDDCWTGNAPVIYTRVSHYVSWIETVVWPNQK